MAHYDIFRERLAIKHPGFGQALWNPKPRNPDRPVQAGDVGFIRTGKFHRLFNALLRADDPSHELGVPEYHEPLVPSLLKHIDKGTRRPINYCSAGVTVGADTGYYSNGPSDFRQVSFKCTSTRKAAVLSLPVTTHCEDTIAKGAFGRWMVQHIDSWFAFARKLGLGIEEMEKIILVTGCDRTRSWTNVAFLGGEIDAQVSFGVKAGDPDTNINFQLSPELNQGAVIDHGPEGRNLPENQCVFIRGFRVARSFWPLPRHLKAAAGPSPDPGRYNCDPDTELLSTPDTNYRDPLHLLQDYVAGQVPDCDMVLAHDNDLMMIAGIGGHGTSLETLEPDVMMDLLRKSNIEVHTVMCELPTTNSLSGPNTGMTTVKVAMLPMTFKNWTSPSQRSSIAQNIDISHTIKSQGVPPPAVSSTLPAPTTVQNTLEGPYSYQSANEPLMTDTILYSPPTAQDIDISLGTTIQNPLRGSYYQPAIEPLRTDTAFQSRWSPVAAQNVDIGLTSDSRGTPPPYVSGSLPMPTVGQSDWGDRASFTSHALLPSFPESGPNTVACSPSQGFPAGAPHSTGRPSRGHTEVPRKRRALVIGTNYSSHPDPRFKLKYCIEDAYGMADFLRDNFSLAPNEVRIMTDEADNPWDLPTKENILGAMRTLVDSAQPGDGFFFYFSGHGVQIKDTNRDKLDGLDECICAMDYRGDDPYPNANTPGLIVDNVMHEILVRPLPRQCRLTAIFDSCHSGTILDLPYVYDSDGVAKPYKHPDKLWLLSQKASYADVISLSNSKDDPRSFETDQGGALRWAFIENVRAFGDTLTYRGLFGSIREYTKRRGSQQRPQLSTSHEIDTNIRFTTLGETDYQESSIDTDTVHSRGHSTPAQP